MRKPCKGGYNFVATQPEAVCDDSDCKQLVKVGEIPTATNNPDGFYLHKPRTPGHTLSMHLTPITSTAPANSTETNSTASPRELPQSGQL